MQSYINNRATACALQKSRNTQNRLTKAMLKRCDFRARRKEGCESISLMLTGRLFQMSDPQTEKARRAN